MAWSVQVRLRGKMVRIMRRAEMGPDDKEEAGARVTESDVSEWLRSDAFVLTEMARHVRSSGFSDAPRKVVDGFRNGELVVLEWRKGSAVGTEDTSSPAPPPKQDKAPVPSEKPEKTWFRAQLFDEDGIAMAKEDYILVDSNGTRRTGKLDDKGEVYIPPILDPGDCTINFPNIHLNPRKKKK